MKKILVGSLSVLLTMFPCLRASAWGHATLMVVVLPPTGDSTTRTNAYGGSATHTAGEDTTASNKYGAFASHAEGSGTTTASNAYGGSATHYAGQGTTASNAYGDRHITLKVLGPQLRPMPTGAALRTTPV